MLNMPDGASRMPEEMALKHFSAGVIIGSGHSRVRGDPEVGMMEDYSAVVNLLFAKRDAAAAAFYAQAQAGGNPGRPSDTTLDRVKKIWERLFVERELILSNNVISARIRGASTYPARLMSDGERVGFYLIASVLLSKHSTIVIDEPEIHVHQSIQGALWDLLESERKDCTFVYITHDLTFAATRVNAAKILLYDYNPSRAGLEWDWALAPANCGLPEDLVLRIAGSRRPTLFVEGERGSLDERIIQTLYPEQHVVPGSGCEEVIRAVQTLRQHDGLHRFEVRGFVDRDDRDEQELRKLEGQGVYALPVACIENILILPQVLRAVAAHQRLASDGPESPVTKAKQEVTADLRNNYGKVVRDRARHSAHKRLRKIEPTGDDKDNFLASFSNGFQRADLALLYDRAKSTVDAVVNEIQSEKAYDGALSLHRNKGMLATVSRFFGLRAERYQEIAIGLLFDDENLRRSVRARFPLDAGPACTDSGTSSIESASAE
jgi:hypothetical protein